MEKQFRTIVFVIPAALSAAVAAIEMAVDFLSKVDLLADDACSLGTQLRRGVLQAVRRSLRDGQRQVAMSIDVFPEACVIRVSQQGSSAKQLIIHWTRDFGESRESDQVFSVNRKVSVS